MMAEMLKREASTLIPICAAVGVWEMGKANVNKTQSTSSPPPDGKASSPLRVVGGVSQSKQGKDPQMATPS